MPEGHTIHRLAREQRRELVGHRLATDVVQDRFTDGARRLHRHRLESVEAWGKHLFQWWESGDILHVHLGLYGKWRRQPSPPAPMRGAVRIRLIGPERTWDLSGATTCELLTPEDRDRVLARLGPDPLRRDADPQRFAARVARSRAPIGTLLMNQAVVAGIGNVYRAEILFICGINPWREGVSLTADEIEAMWAEMVEQLVAGVRRNRIVTRRPEEAGRAVGRLGRHDALYVYHRDVCRVCGGPIRTEVLAARKTWWCPTCQPLPQP